MAVNRDLVAQMDSVLNTFKLNPVQINQSVPEPQTLLKNEKKDFSDAVPGHSGVISWSPPQPNWNPWTGCNIDEGPLAHVRIYCKGF